jgi:hypothetical protein
LDIPVKEVLYFQIVLELVLMVLLFWFLWRTKTSKGSKDSKDSQALDQEPKVALPQDFKDSLERFLAEAEKLSAVFAQNLEDKKKLTTDLILKLDARLKDYQALLTFTEEALVKALGKLKEIEDYGIQQSQNSLSQKANPAAPEVRALVLKLAKEGQSVEDIALRSHLHRGEVELILDLENQFKI